MFPALWTAWTSTSPSSRRAWIEIGPSGHRCRREKVALLAEGVDRNCTVLGVQHDAAVALLAEGVDRNHIAQHIHLGGNGRPPRGGRG